VVVIRAKAISEARPPAIPPASLPVPIPDTRTSVGNWRAKKEPEATSMADAGAQDDCGPDESRRPGVEGPEERFRPSSVATLRVLVSMVA
jgi:hypothetical protein